MHFNTKFYYLSKYIQFYFTCSKVLNKKVKYFELTHAYIDM